MGQLEEEYALHINIKKNFLFIWFILQFLTLLKAMVKIREKQPHVDLIRNYEFMHKNIFNCYFMRKPSI
jgi:hypothetical protein